MTNIKALLLACVLLITPLMASVDPSEVTTLDLSDRTDVTSISALGTLPKLRHLDLSHNEKITDLEEIGRLTTLTTLNLSLVFNRNDISYPKTFDFLMPLTFLRELNLSGNDYIFYIKTLLRLPNLTSLDISYCPSIQDWESLTRFPALKMLKMELPHIIRCSLDLSFLTEMSLLESLYINKQTKLPTLSERIRVYIEK